MWHLLLMLTDPGPFLLKDRLFLSLLGKMIVLSDIDCVQQRPDNKNQTAAKLHPYQVTSIPCQDNDRQRIDERYAYCDDIVDILLLVGGDQRQVRQSPIYFASVARLMTRTRQKM